MQFDSKILSGKKTATGIVVPGEVIEGLKGGKRPAVVVRVNGYVYRTTVGSMSGLFMLPLSAEHRDRSGLKAGDPVKVDLELDTQPRVLDVPDDFQRALAGDPVAKGFFGTLSYSKRRWFVLNIESAKTPATREKRIASALQSLSAESAP